MLKKITSHVIGFESRGQDQGVALQG